MQKIPTNVKRALAASSLARKTFEDAVAAAIVECLQCPKPWVQVCGGCGVKE